MKKVVQNVVLSQVTGLVDQVTEYKESVQSANPTVKVSMNSILLDLIMTGLAKKPAKKPVAKKMKAVAVVDDRVSLIIDQYNSIMGKKCQYTAGRQKLISERLADCGHDAIIQAIHGCTQSPHHMGQNTQRTAYNSIEFICRNVETIEKFTQNVGVIQRETVQPNNTKLSAVQAAKQRLEQRATGQTPSGHGSILEMDDRDLFQ